MAESDREKLSDPLGSIQDLNKFLPLTPKKLFSIPFSRFRYNRPGGYALQEFMAKYWPIKAHFPDRAPAATPVISVGFDLGEPKEQQFAELRKFIPYIPYDKSSLFHGVLASRVRTICVRAHENWSPSPFPFGIRRPLPTHRTSHYLLINENEKAALIRLFVSWKNSVNEHGKTVSINKKRTIKVLLRGSVDKVFSFAYKKYPCYRGHREKLYISSIANRSLYKGTDIERIVRAELIKVRAKFYEQAVICPPRASIDFYIHPKICVFADGEHWHAMPHKIKRDREVTRALIGFGCKVLRFKESDIKSNSEKCLKPLMAILKKKGLLKSQSRARRSL